MQLGGISGHLCSLEKLHPLADTVCIPQLFRSLGHNVSDLNATDEFFLLVTILHVMSIIVNSFVSNIFLSVIAISLNHHHNHHHDTNIIVFIIHHHHRYHYSHHYFLVHNLPSELSALVSSLVIAVNNPSGKSSLMRCVCWLLDGSSHAALSCETEIFPTLSCVHVFLMSNTCTVNLFLRETEEQACLSSHIFRYFCSSHQDLILIEKPTWTCCVWTPQLNVLSHRIFYVVLLRITLHVFMTITPETCL